MPILIIVSGSTNSGKTSSIRHFANHLVNAPNIPAKNDFLHAGQLIKGQNPYQIGIASSGDTAAAVQHAIGYFLQNNCNLMICATKTNGASVFAIEAFMAANPNMDVYRITTFPAQQAAVNSPAAMSRHALTANTIWQLIP